MNRDVLDARRLRCVRAVAEHGSMSAAARGPNLAQPALSCHVAGIEAGLALRLFERRHDGGRQTAAGEGLLRHTRGGAEAIAAAEDEMRAQARAAAPRQRLRFAIVPAPAEDPIPPSPASSPA
jgi:DNA-binding transcriptional LysR family regulator